MNWLLKNKISFYLRMLFIFLGFFAFQNSIVAESSSIIHLGFNPISEIYTCEENESPVWVKDSHRSRVSWAILKREVGSESGSTLLNVGIAARGSSRILNATTKQLQTKFKHAADFGVTGNWNKAAAGRFNSAINQHINSPGIKIIQGTYHKQPAIHYLNPKTGLNVISRPNGQFWSGWKLSPGQLQNVLQHGGL
ncbi:MAG: colicin D domain-containing protein [Bacteroidota bacterium]